VLSLVEANDISITHVTKQSVTSVDGLDDRQLVELTFTKEFESVNQVVVGAQRDGASVDEIVGKHERTQMFEILSIPEVIER
jgi:hypothetical protein